MRFKPVQFGDEDSQSGPVNRGTVVGGNAGGGVGLVCPSVTSGYASAEC
jgi:hypothetical protein